MNQDSKHINADGLIKGDHWGLALHFSISMVKLFHFHNH